MERVWKRENPPHFGWEYKLTQPLWIRSWRFPKQLNTELSYDPAISLLGKSIWRKNIIWKDMCIPVFIAELFTRAKTQKKVKCPPRKERIKKMWHIYVIEYYWTIRKNEIMSFATTGIDLEIIILNETSQRKTNII